MVPKVVFKKMSLEDNIDIVKWAYFDKNDDLSMREYTIELFPELMSISEDADEKMISQMIKNVVCDVYTKKKDDILLETERYNEIWNEYNDVYFNKLEEYFGVSFPSEIDEISAYVGMIPIFPRDLDDFSFSLSAFLSDDDIIKVCAHETLHFIWFTKWKTMFPKYDTTHFNAPHVEWKYSEMVTDPILNNKPFSDLFSFTERGYDSFYTMYDKEGLVIDKLRKIYAKEMDVDEKIIEGFDYIKSILNKNVNK